MPETHGHKMGINLSAQNSKTDFCSTLQISKCLVNAHQSLAGVF